MRVSLKYFRPEVTSALTYTNSRLDIQTKRKIKSYQLSKSSAQRDKKWQRKNDRSGQATKLVFACYLAQRAYKLICILDRVILSTASICYCFCFFLCLAADSITNYVDLANAFVVYVPGNRDRVAAASFLTISYQYYRSLASGVLQIFRRLF
jgi:hypothetical protein